MGRFTKAAMMKALSDKMEKIRREFNFNLDNGTSQLKGALGSTDAVVAYGRYRECEFLLIEIEEGRIRD
jgi:hypothetical protein